MTQAGQVGRRRTEWRYAAAGLGWGVAVGAATGLLVALWVVVGALTEAEGRVFEWLGLVVGVPVYGALLGATIGGVAGLPGGVVNALVQPSVRGDRAAWWSSWAVASLAAVAVVGSVAGWRTHEAVAGEALDWAVHDGVRAASLALAPALVGGWLTARTGRTLRRRTPMREHDVLTG